MTILTPHLLALARRRTYYLFGRLFLEGVVDDLWPLLEAVPELAELAAGQDPDQLAAGHYHLVSTTAFPYESIILDPTGLLGGAVASQLTAVYRQNGFQVESDPDHIGHELLFMSHLCAAEVGALSQGAMDIAALWGSRQQSFLAAHLLAWLAPLVTAVQRTGAVEKSGDAFYGRLAGLTLELCADHLSKTHTVDSPMPLPPAPDLAADDSGLKQIAGYLATPPYSGLFLSRDAISALARRHNLPRGFGDRSQLLTNLLRSAGQYDLAADVIHDLSRIWSDWCRAYAQKEQTYPHLAPWIRPWQDRAAQTAGSLDLIVDRLKQA